MLPDLLLRPRRVSAGTKNSPHLINTSEDDLPGNKPANTLRARRAGQATLVRPELVEVKNALEQRCEVHGGRLLSTHLCVTDHRRQLIEESGVVVTRVETNGQDGGFVAGGVDVDKMELGFATVTTYRVIGWGVNVPALEVDGLVVVGEVWVGRPVNVFLCCVLIMCNGEGGTVTPVVEVTRDAAVVLESRHVV